MTDAILVWGTAPNEETAAALCRTLVEEHLAACGSVVPGLRSVYRWDGKIQDDREAGFLLKTRAGLFGAVRARILQLHPYEVPEVLQVNVADGHAPYLQWVLASVRAS